MNNPSVEAAVAAIRSVVDGIAKLERAVDNLERVEHARMQQARLAAWNHVGIRPNGHGKELR
jgi:hypothetical protein